MASADPVPQLQVYVWKTDFNNIRNDPGHVSLELINEGKRNYLSHWPAESGREPRQAENTETFEADLTAEGRKPDSSHVLTLTSEQAKNVNQAIEEVKKLIASGEYKYYFMNDPSKNAFNCSGMVEKLLYEQKLISKEYAELIAQASEGSMPDRVAEQLKSSWKNRDTMETNAKPMSRL